MGMAIPTLLSKERPEKHRDSNGTTQLTNCPACKTHTPGDRPASRLPMTPATQPPGAHLAVALAQKDLRGLELVDSPVGFHRACPNAARHAKVRHLEAEAAGVVVGGGLDYGGDGGGGGAAVGGGRGGSGGGCADRGAASAVAVSLRGGGGEEDAGWLQISVYLPIHTYIFTTSLTIAATGSEKEPAAFRGEDSDSIVSQRRPQQKNASTFRLASQFFWVVDNLQHQQQQREQEYTRQRREEAPSTFQGAEMDARLTMPLSWRWPTTPTKTLHTSLASLSL